VAVEAALKAQDYGWNVNYSITIGDAFLVKQNYGEAKKAFSKAQMIDPENEKVCSARVSGHRVLK
jgi:predicted negative regulator of RcsB-dependent stress response